MIPDAASANARGRRKYFIYYGRGEEIPWGVTHVKIDSSVATIKDEAFDNRRQLRIAILNEKLEEIGVGAFHYCISLEVIVVPNAVRAIRKKAFKYCSGLTSVTLGNGLEEIGESAFLNCTMLSEINIPDAVRTIKKWAFGNCSGLKSVTLGKELKEIGEDAFYYCRSLQEIVIPDGVRTIKKWAFRCCHGLTTVTLGNGLEEIGEEAFDNCASLQHIDIPPAVKEIDDSAFRGCTNLMRVQFCKEIEDFVSSEAMQERWHWWNGGVDKKSLGAYNHLVKFNIPNRLAPVRVKSWRDNIHDMLGRLPTLTNEGMASLFVAIDSKLTLYESMVETPMLMKLVIKIDDVVERILSFF